jgi:hypothetical protein
MSGSGNQSPGAPDLSKNIGNANQTFNTATSNAGQTFNTAQAYNQNAQNTLSQVNGANTPMMNQVNQTAGANLNSYNQNFMPLQQQQVQQAKDYTNDQNVQQLQGMAVADQNASLQSSLANQRSALASEGVDPASVHGSALTTQAGIQGAANNANAANQSYLQTQATGRGLVQGANQLGLQVGQAGTTGAQAGSGIGTQMVGNQNQTNAAGINNLTAANTYLGTANNANQSSAGIAGQQYNEQLTEQQANAARDNGKWSAVGTALGMAGGFASNFQRGGVVPGYARGGPVGHPSQHLGMAQQPPVAPFSGGGVLPRQLPNNYDMGGPVGGYYGMQGPTMMDMTGVANAGYGNAPGMPGAIGSPGSAPSPLAGNYANPMVNQASGNWDGGAMPVNAVPNAPSQGGGGGGNSPGAGGAQLGNFQGSPMAAVNQDFVQGFGAGKGGGGGGGAAAGMMSGMMARGGPVAQQGALPNSPIPGSTDTKPAWLTPGEFVIPHDVAAWKGHEYWYKQMDKARADMHAQHGALPPPPMAMTTRGH